MRSTPFFFTLMACACASPPAYQCSSPTDSSGYGIALCHDPMQTPVCDDPGVTAHYQMNTMGGYTLEDGAPADCDTSDQVVCPDRMAAPHCITQPIDP